MPSLQEIMGHDIYHLIYTHYDEHGDRIDDFEDVLLCEDCEIDTSKIEPLKKLLIPASHPKETLIPIEAAKLLAAWGVDDAIDYFDHCINDRIDRLGTLEPHRLHGYDTTYEMITEALLNYHARYADRSQADTAFKKIRPLIEKILLLAKELPYNMSYILSAIQQEGHWRCFETVLKECLICFLERNERSRNDYWNIIDLALLFQKWDVDFLNHIESRYGVIEIPKNAQEDV